MRYEPSIGAVLVSIPMTSDTAGERFGLWVALLDLHRARAAARNCCPSAVASLACAARVVSSTSDHGSQRASFRSTRAVPLTSSVQSIRCCIPNSELSTRATLLGGPTPCAGAGLAWHELDRRGSAFRLRKSSHPFLRGGCLVLLPIRGVDRIEQALASHSLRTHANLGSAGDSNHAARLSDKRSEPAGRLIAPRPSKDPTFHDHYPHTGRAVLGA